MSAALKVVEMADLLVGWRAAWTVGSLEPLTADWMAAPMAHSTAAMSVAGSAAMMADY